MEKINTSTMPTGNQLIEKYLTQNNAVRSEVTFKTYPDNPLLLKVTEKGMKAYYLYDGEHFVKGENLEFRQQENSDKAKEKNYIGEGSSNTVESKKNLNAQHIIVKTNGGEYSKSLINKTNKLFFELQKLPPEIAGHYVSSVISGEKQIQRRVDGVSLLSLGVDNPEDLENARPLDKDIAEKNLRDYLQEHRLPSAEECANSLANALKNSRFSHNDIAARNIMIDVVNKRMVLIDNDDIAFGNSNLEKNKALTEILYQEFDDDLDTLNALEKKPFEDNLVAVEKRCKDEDLDYSDIIRRMNEFIEDTRETEKNRDLDNLKSTFKCFNISIDNNINSSKIEKIENNILSKASSQSEEAEEIQDEFDDLKEIMQEISLYTEESQKNEALQVLDVIDIDNYDFYRKKPLNELLICGKDQANFLPRLLNNLRNYGTKSSEPEKIMQEIFPFSEEKKTNTVIRILFGNELDEGLEEKTFDEWLIYARKNLPNEKKYLEFMQKLQKELNAY